MRIDAPPAASQAGPAPRIGPAQIWLIALLMLASILGFADRSILQVLVDPIKADLQIDDVKARLLMGASFTVLYALAALPFGALVDIVDRRKLLASAIIIWSGMTILSGFSHNFGEFFVGRMGLGIAEAALGPAAFSLIRDSFPVTHRGRAFATMQASHLLGTGSALIVGGGLYGLASGGAFVHVPLFGHLQPWQQVLICMGFIGFPVGVLVMTVREPPRTASLEARKGPGFAPALSFVWRNKSVFLPYWSAVALIQIGQGGLSSWTVMAVRRTWHIPIPAIATVLGPIQMVMALAGAFVMGTTLDLVAKRGVRDAPLKVACICLTISTAAATSQFFIGPLSIAVIAYVAMLLFHSINSTAASAALALMSPSAYAGKLQAVTGLAISLVGLAFGPTIVALVSKHLFSGPRAMHDGLVTVFTVTTFGGVLMYLLVLRALRRRRLADMPDLAAAP